MLTLSFFIICNRTLIDVGVEVQLEDKPIVIDSIDCNSTLVDDIQFVGRFRQGIKKLYLVGKLNNSEPFTKQNSFIEEYEKELKANKEWEKTFNTNKIETISFNDLDLDKTSRALEEEKRNKRCY